MTLDKTLNLTNEVILMLFYEGRVEKRTGIMGMPWGGYSRVTSRKESFKSGDAAVGPPVHAIVIYSPARLGFPVADSQLQLPRYGS